MAPLRDAAPIDTLVFDIIGTLVDHHGGLRAAVADLVPGADDAATGELLTLWRRHVAAEHRRIVAGERPYAGADVLDREAAHEVARHAGAAGDGAVDRAAVDRAALVTRHLSAWPDSADMLDRLAARYELVGLSNADRTTLTRLNAHAGLRWHAALSSETARSYKPDAGVYRLAVEHTGRAPERMLMVAAHAWDLRGARAAGMRTAFLDRPGADRPAPDDVFDHHFASTADLLDLLATGTPA